MAIKSVFTTLLVLHPSLCRLLDENRLRFLNSDDIAIGRHPVNPSSTWNREHRSRYVRKESEHKYFAGDRATP